MQAGRDDVRLLRWGPAGRERPALVDTDGAWRDLSAHVTDIDGITLGPDGLEKLSNVDVELLPLVSPDTRIGPCVARVGKIVGVGLNYRSHALEAGMSLPDEPLLFIKPSSAICGPNDPVLVPPASTTLDYEVELGVVVGHLTRRVTQTDAWNHVAGYCVVNDLTERTWQLHRGGTWDKGKAHDTFAPIGPWLVTADEIDDPHDLDMHLAVDDETRQLANTNDMHHRVDHLISYISHFMALHPGDIVTTGTPAGTALGRADHAYLRSGQSLLVAIEGLGVQHSSVEAARL
jgi:2-keto-4-pentenoate hydratase/2-oxohepta-3-ene-1,7-dioic acid hydratase in catechol pathway